MVLITRCYFIKDIGEEGILEFMAWEPGWAPRISGYYRYQMVMDDTLSYRGYYEFGRGVTLSQAATIISGAQVYNSCQYDDASIVSFLRGEGCSTIDGPYSRGNKATSHPLVTQYKFHHYNPISRKRDTI